MSEPSHSVLLIDDHRAFAEAFQYVLQKQSCFHVLEIATNGTEGYEAALRLRPQLIIADVELPGRGIFDVAKSLKNAGVTAPFVILSAFCSQAFAEMARSVPTAGYLLKSEPIAVIVAALERVIQGSCEFSPGVPASPTAVYDHRVDSAQPAALAGLNARQIEMLRLLARGYTVKEVARIMDLTMRTVDSQKHRLMKRFGLRDRVQLAHFAHREGLIVESGTAPGSPSVAKPPEQPPSDDLLTDRN